MIKKRVLACFTGALLVMNSAMLCAATKEASLDDLLKKVASGSYEESAEQQKREQIFLAENKKQALLLEDIQGEYKRLESESAKLEQAFDDNEKLIDEADEQLKQSLGSLTEIFGHINSAASDFKTTVEGSVISVHYAKRVEFLNTLISMTGGGSKLPSIEQINQLMFEIQREMTEQGRLVKFSAPVITLNGELTVKPLLRIGAFNIVDENGHYLSYADERLGELIRQPASHYVNLAQDLHSHSQGFALVGIDPTGPTAGSLLSALVSTPSLLEQWHQGGKVGYLITFLGMLAIVIAVWRLMVLMGVDKKVQVQLTSTTYDNNNPLGRVLLAAQASSAMTLESLELKMNEAMLKEFPKLQAWETFLKIIASVAPLLGLLGTVTGMIITFQSITVYGAGDPQAMSGGISAALVTTVLGLLVAIPTLLLLTFISTRSKRIIHILEQQAAGIVAQHQEVK